MGHTRQYLSFKTLYIFFDYKPVDPRPEWPSVSEALFNSRFEARHVFGLVSALKFRGGIVFRPRRRRTDGEHWSNCRLVNVPHQGLSNTGAIYTKRVKFTQIVNFKYLLLCYKLYLFSFLSLSLLQQHWSDVRR